MKFKVGDQVRVFFDGLEDPAGEIAGLPDHDNDHYSPGSSCYSVRVFDEGGWTDLPIREGDMEHLSVVDRLGELA